MQRAKFLGLIAIAALTWLAVSSPALAELPPYKTMNLVNGAKKVAGEGCGVDLAVTNRAGLDDVTAANVGQEIRVVVQRAYVDPPTRTLATLADSCVERVRAYQISRTQVDVVLTLRRSYNGERTLTVRPTADGLRVYVGPAPEGALPPPAAPATPEPTAAAPAAPTATAADQAKIDMAGLLANAAAPNPTATHAAPVAPPSPPAVAEQRAPAGSTSLTGELDWKSAVTKVVVALCVTLGVMFLLVALAKRLRLPARVGGGKSGMIRVVQTAMLDLKHRVAVVDVAGELLVVALAGNDVTMLTKIESDEARRRILQLDQPEKPAPQKEPAFIQRAVAPELPVQTDTAFAQTLKAQPRRASNDWEVADNGTLKAIAERVKDLKRL